MNTAPEIGPNTAIPPPMSHLKMGLPPAVKAEITTELSEPNQKVLQGEIVNRFDYSKIADPEARDIVQGVAKRILGNLRQEKALLLDTGRALQEAKAIKGFGFFDAWVAAEFEFTKRTAGNYMALARAFGETYELVSYLPLQNLYKLAMSTDLEDVREEVITAAKSGQSLPKREVQRRIDDTKAGNAPQAHAAATPLIKGDADAGMSAASNAVALLRDKLDDDFIQFVEWFHEAGEAFTIVLNNSAQEVE